MKAYKLTHNGNTIHKGSADSCYLKLQKAQSQSAHHAIKYEGWKVEEMEISEEQAAAILAADPYSYSAVILLEDAKGAGNYRLKAYHNGEHKYINTYAAKIAGAEKAGAVVEVMNAYIY